MEDDGGRGPDGTAQGGGHSRRAVLEAAGVTVVAGVVGYVGMTALAPAQGAGGDDGYAAPGQDGGGGDGDGTEPDDAGEAQDDAGDGDAADEDGEVVAALSDVPDGGGVVLTDRRVVLVRDGDDVHAFTAVCTHQGCLVGGVTGGEIRCPCHGSAFDARDGKVVQGPATEDLAEVDVDVRDGQVVLR